MSRLRVAFAVREVSYVVPTLPDEVGTSIKATTLFE